MDTHPLTNKQSLWTDKIFTLKCNMSLWIKVLYEFLSFMEHEGDSYVYFYIDRPWVDIKQNFKAKFSVNNLNICLFPTQIYFTVNFFAFYQLWSHIYFLFYVRMSSFVFHGIKKVGIGMTWVDDFSFLSEPFLYASEPCWTYYNKPVKTHLSNICHAAWNLRELNPVS